MLFFSLRSPLTEPLSVIDVAYWALFGPEEMSGLSPQSVGRIADIVQNVLINLAPIL